MEQARIIRTKSSTSPPESDLASARLLQSQIERLETQFSRLRDQVRLTQQLASLGTAAAMMAHEFNNLMTPVVSYARYALDNDDVELMKKALEMTLKQASTVSAMSERILGLAVHEAPKPAHVQIGEVVKEAAACLCRDPEKDGITQRVDIPPDLIVWADERQLRQVFFNLLLNARQAIQHRSGMITVTAESADDSMVAIHIKDNGCGIDPANLENIFDPFFTTKTGDANGNKKGTGLGLALCNDIVEEQRGQISVQSEPGHGTTFTITLPTAP